MSERISVFPAKIKWDQITPWWRIFRLTRDCMLRPSLLCCLQFGQRLKLALISAAAACPNAVFSNLISETSLFFFVQSSTFWLAGHRAHKRRKMEEMAFVATIPYKVTEEPFVHFWKEKGTDERKIGTHCLLTFSKFCASFSCCSSWGNNWRKQITLENCSNQNIKTSF